MELLSQYTLSEIFVFTSVLVAFIVGSIKTLSYLNEKYRLFLTKKVREAKRQEEVDECRLQNRKDIEKLTDLVNILLESDKCRIRSEIVQKHGEFASLGSIDNYSLDSLSKQFECYQAMGGNSYVERLMNDLARLKGN